MDERARPLPLLRPLLDRHQRGGNVADLLRRLAQVGDDAALAFRPPRLADVAPMQDQPVMRMPQILRRYDLQETLLDLVGRLAGRQAEPVAEAKNVGVDRQRMLA